MEPSFGINGEIFSQIGEFNNLRFINIERIRRATAQIPVLNFGGGILNKLEYFNCGSNFTMNNASQLEKDNFIKSFLEMAPNIKDIGKLSLVDGMQILDYTNQLGPLLTNFPILGPFVKKKHDKMIENWLSTSKILETIHWTVDLDLSHIAPILTVKKLSLNQLFNEKHMKELGRIFPSITELVVLTEGDTDLLNILKDGTQWPDLQYAFPISEEILEFRPFLDGEDTDCNPVKAQDKILDFNRRWIINGGSRDLFDVEFSEMSSNRLNFKNLLGYLVIE